jgi:hypothetical protein
MSNLPEKLMNNRYAVYSSFGLFLMTKREAFISPDRRVFSPLAPRTQPKFAAARLYEPQTASNAIAEIQKSRSRSRPGNNTKAPRPRKKSALQAVPSTPGGFFPAAKKLSVGAVQ